MVASDKENQNNSDNKLNWEQPQNNEHQLDFDELTSKQQDRLFREYALQQQREQLALLNQKDKDKFEQLVSPKELEKLIQMRADKLKEDYAKQRLNKADVSQNQLSPENPSLTQEYLNFKKAELAEKEAETKKSERGFLGTKPPDSPHDFKAWYYAGTASEEFQISGGIIPPQNLTPSGAVWYSQLVADSKRIKAENLVEVEKERLKEAGFSPEQIREQENAIRKQAFSQVGEQWKQERAEALKVWQESKGLKSFQKFTTTQPQPHKDPVEVKVEDLEKWRQEARELGRSNNHLEKIDQIVNSAKDNTNDAASSVKINERDFKAMQRDRFEFNQQSQVEQTHTLVRGIGIR